MSSIINLNPEQIHDALVAAGYCLRPSKEGWRCLPLHRDSGNPNSLSIRYDGSWYDFAEDRGGPTIFSLLSLTCDKKWVEELRESGRLNNQGQCQLIEPVKIKTPRMWNQDCLKLLSPSHDYWNQRNIPDHIIKQYKGGLAYRNEMKGRYVFPVFDWRNSSRIAGFAGRDVLPAPEIIDPKFIRPKWKLMGDKNNWIWPLNSEKSILETRELILVESIGDVLSLKRDGINNVVALFGINISDAIKRFIIRCSLSTIIVATNRDKDGIGERAAAKIEWQLKRIYASKNVVVCLPILKDFGEQDTTCNKEWLSKL